MNKYHLVHGQLTGFLRVAVPSEVSVDHNYKHFDNFCKPTLSIIEHAGTFCFQCDAQQKGCGMRRRMEDIVEKAAIQYSLASKIKKLLKLKLMHL